MSTAHEPLKLIALDADDLSVMSAHLQDAVSKVADMAYLPAEKRFALVVNRFDWACSEHKDQRCRTGVHFNRVLSARTRGVDLNDQKQVLNLLAIEFEEKDAPSGKVTLFFSGDAAIQLDVEVLEAAMSDLNLVWPTKKRPAHDVGGGRE
jgi:hypothetical protein